METIEFGFATRLRSLVFSNASGLGALASAVIATVGLHAEMTLRFMLLSFLLSVIYYCQLPRLLDRVITCLVIGSAVLGACDAYRDAWWLDDVAHLIVTSVLAVGATRALGRLVGEKGLEAMVLRTSMEGYSQPIE